MTLVGEARFTVVHDAVHPFLIRTATAVVRDVGTVFSVHSDGAESVRVVVSEGAVDVQDRSGASHQRLAAGDIAVATGAGIEVQRGAASAEDLAWTAGRLVFRDASVAQVTADLRRWYGVEVKVDTALIRRPVTASFDRGMPAADVAKIIAATIGGVLRDEAGVFHIISVPAGVFVISLPRFLLYSSLGTLLWNTFLAGAGYALESQYTRIADYLNPASNVVVGLIVFSYLYRISAWKAE